jgi:isoamylase
LAIVSYNDKHNEANGEDNRDGHSNNHSWNHGAEGPTDDPDIVELRERQKRNFLGTLLFSQGTPMLLAGDEFGRTQQGNNNAYCQDNEVSWVNWRFDERAEALVDFTKRLTALRRRYPVLRRSRFLTGSWNEELGVKDSTWLTPIGKEMQQQDWHNPTAKCFGLLLDGRAPTSGIRQRGSEATLLLITNGHHDVVRFTLPKVTGGRDWRRLVDTSRPAEDDDPDRPTLFKLGHHYQVTGRSLLLFVLRQARRAASNIPRA